MEFGLTDTNDNDAILHKLALEHAREKYLAIDYSKLDKASFSKIAPVSILDGIIMDRSFPVPWIKYLGENQVHIY